MGGGVLYFSYDGGQIGKFTSDAIRNITGEFGLGPGYGVMGLTYNPIGAFKRGTLNENSWAGNNPDAYNVVLDASLAIPTGTVTKPGGISVQVCITF